MVSIVSSEAATAVGAAVGTGVVLSVALFALLRRARPFIHMWDDLAGEAARPGVPRQPGISERVAAAADDAKSAKLASYRVERLLIRHMENTKTLQDAYLHNEAQLHQALAAQGIVIEGEVPYPKIDIGDTDDRPPM